MPLVLHAMDGCAKILDGTQRIPAADLILFSPGAYLTSGPMTGRCRRSRPVSDQSRQRSSPMSRLPCPLS